MKKVWIALFAFWAVGVSAQKINRVDPPNWWVGMELNTVELMLYGEGVAELAQYEASSTSLEIVSSKALESSNYAFVTVRIPEGTKAGKHTIEFRNQKGRLVTSLKYELWAREEGSRERKGFSSADIIYLITPDRFRNGDPSNDRVKGMQEGPNREFIGGRHGGDLEGVIQSLDYFESLGISSLWLNPVLENDMPSYSYHGYAMTDLYNVDARYGSNEDYRRLAEEAKARGMGLILDQVANHIGSSHPWMADLPSQDWVNQWGTFTQTNHMKVSRFDPHGAEVDRRQFTDGWFVETMPDLNQRQPQLAQYLIQNSIWWVEYTGAHGIRMDTWPYPDMDFLADWTRVILEEYPKLNIVGEEWVASSSLISYWQAGTKRHDTYESYLPSVMDFPLQEAVVKGLTGEASWRSSMTAIYESLADDYKYGDLNNIMIFPDNHDMSRIYTQLDEDYEKWRMAMAFFYTTRGTLQLYYGTEILMTNPGTEDHGVIRSDFPGGWEGDPVNAFTGEGLTSEQRMAQEWIAQLGKLRRGSCALNMGSLLHFIPLDEVYVYFREFEQERVMVVLNRNETPVKLDLARFQEGLRGSTGGEELLSGAKVSWSEVLELAPMEVMIVSLK